LEVTVAIIAKIKQVIASFEAELVVIFLRGGGSLETSELLVLELVGGEEDTLAFFLLFLLVTRVKVTSLVSGISTIISISEESVKIRLGL